MTAIEQMKAKLAAIETSRGAQLATVYECIDLLEKAGMGKPGTPNTLLSMVQEIIASRDGWKESHDLLKLESEQEIAALKK